VNYINGPHHDDGNEPPCEFVPSDATSFFIALNGFLVSGPVCRAPVTPHKWFLRSAFEPTEAELAALTHPAEGQSEDVVMADVDEDLAKVSDLMGSIGGVKTSERQNSAQVFELKEGDTPGSVVQNEQGEEGEEDEERRRAIEKRLGKRKAVVVSDDEEDLSNVIRGKKTANMSSEQVKLSSKFLPSTKMKAKIFFSFLSPLLD
jgi:hypothetical protein